MTLQKVFSVNGHSVSRLAVHLIFTTKYRRKLFDGGMIEQLRKAFYSAAAKLECEIVEMDGERDHVHLLIAYPPKLAVSVMVNNLKSVSSRLLRQQRQMEISEVRLKTVL